MKLVASGCSVTHGAELEHPFMSDENAQQSYPALLAKNLNCMKLFGKGQYLHKWLVLY